MKILIVRCDGIGDALVCAPLVAALRDAGHELGIVLGVGNRDVFAKRTFARVHVLERIPWPEHGSTPKSRTKALADVRAIGYDVALIASEEVEAYAFAKDAKIPRRIGFINGWEKPFKTVQVKMMLTQSILRPATERTPTNTKCARSSNSATDCTTNRARRATRRGFASSCSTNPFKRRRTSCCRRR